MQMINPDDSPDVSQFPRRPFIAGFWLILPLPLAAVVAIVMETFVHRQSLRETIGIPMLLAIIGGTAFLWARSLVKRSGYQSNWRVGLAGAVAFVAMIVVVEFGAYDLIFGNAMKLLGVTQTQGGTHPEFYVVFVIWTGIVVGGCGLAVGMALKQPKLALKLLGVGLITGAVVFFFVAIVMELIGFRVGTPRPDGLPSMPIVTAAGIWTTALIGSEVFGRVLAREKKRTTTIQ
jgi:hypothetical protein